MILAIITILGFTASATSRLERLAAANGGSAPLDPRNISESEFLQDDVQRLDAIERRARASEQAALDTYSCIVTEADAEITRINQDLATLDQQDLEKQNTLTKIQYDTIWIPEMGATRARLDSQIAEQQARKQNAARRRDTDISSARATRTADVKACKIEAVKNVAINKPERALQILTAIYQDKKRRDQGKCAKVVAGTACGAVAGAAAAGAVGFAAGDCMGQCGYSIVHCDIGYTEAGANAAGHACGDPMGAAAGIGGGVVAGSASAAACWPSSHGYTPAEQSLIDLMCANEEAQRRFKSM